MSLIKLIINGKEYPVELLQDLYDVNSGYSNKREWHTKKFKELQTLKNTQRAWIEHSVIKTPFGTFVFKKGDKK